MISTLKPLKADCYFHARSIAMHGRWPLACSRRTMSSSPASPRGAMQPRAATEQEAESDLSSGGSEHSNASTKPQPSARQHRQLQRMQRIKRAMRQLELHDADLAQRQQQQEEQEQQQKQRQQEQKRQQHNGRKTEQTKRSLKQQQQQPYAEAADLQGKPSRAFKRISSLTASPQTTWRTRCPAAPSRRACWRPGHQGSSCATP